MQRGKSLDLCRSEYGELSAVLGPNLETRGIETENILAEEVM